MNQKQRSVLQTAVVEFVDQYPFGWGDNEWNQFLDQLEQKGLSRESAPQYGTELERERLRRTLRHAQVNGLGEKRIDSIVLGFDSLWNLQRASEDQIASIRSVSKKLATELKAALAS